MKTYEGLKVGDVITHRLNVLEVEELYVNDLHVSYVDELLYHFKCYKVRVIRFADKRVIIKLLDRGADCNSFLATDSGWNVEQILNYYKVIQRKEFQPFTSNELGDFPKRGDCHD